MLEKAKSVVDSQGNKKTYTQQLMHLKKQQKKLAQDPSTNVQTIAGDRIVFLGYNTNKNREKSQEKYP